MKRKSNLYANIAAVLFAIVAIWSLLSLCYNALMHYFDNLQTCYTQIEFYFTDSLYKFYFTDEELLLAKAGVFDFINMSLFTGVCFGIFLQCAKKDRTYFLRDLCKFYILSKIVLLVIGLFIFGFKLYVIDQFIVIITFILLSLTIKYLINESLYLTLLKVKYVCFIPSILAFGQTIYEITTHTYDDYQLNFTIGFDLIYILALFFIGLWLYKCSVEDYEFMLKSKSKKISNELAIDHSSSNEIVTQNGIGDSEETDINQTVEKKEILYCRKCGCKLLDGSQFCHKCGIEIVGGE